MPPVAMVSMDVCNVLMVETVNGRSTNQCCVGCVLGWPCRWWIQSQRGMVAHQQEAKRDNFCRTMDFFARHKHNQEQGRRVSNVADAIRCRSFHNQNGLWLLA